MSVPKESPNLMPPIIGTLMPLLSLRSRQPELISEPHGTLATAAEFIEWLKRSGQGAWQMLPLAQTHLEPNSALTRVPSPYRGYGIGLDPQLDSPQLSLPEPTDHDLQKFLMAEGDWLADYALFVILTARFGTDDWRLWPNAFRRHDAAALATLKQESSEEIRRAIAQQWRLQRGLSELHERAKASGIRLIGDLPFYLPVQSPLVWSHQELFEMANDGDFHLVSGVPDGPNSHHGRQVWGHPLYRWSRPEICDQILDLWLMRIRHAAKFYDCLRIDHAKGLFTYGVMDLRHPERDAYRPGPGLNALLTILDGIKSLGIEVLAEDAGTQLQELRRALKRLKISGIKIFRFAYLEKERRFHDEYLNIDRYPRNAYAYTSTHDTVTLLGYLKLLAPPEKKQLARRVRVTYDSDDRRLATHFRDRLMVAAVTAVIMPLQDWLLLTERINVPGTELAVGDLNWRWRMPSAIEDLPLRPVAE